MTKMDPGIKARWVAALRSGEYKQSSMALRSAGGFCCLGVLCDLHAKETCTPWGLPGEGDDLGQYLGRELALPVAVREWAGLVAADPEVVSPGHPRGSLLSNHNDGWANVRPHTFNEIASLIEEQL